MKKNLIGRHLVFVSFILMAQGLIAQVNIESIKSIHDQNHTHSVQFHWSGSNSVSSIQNIDLNYSFNRTYKKNQLLLYMDYKTALKDNRVFENNGIVHIRNMMKIKTHRFIELFLQNQWKDFSSLDNRFLIGSGLRFEEILSSHIKHVDVTLGSGFMYEQEKYFSYKKSEAIRSTSYINFKKVYKKVSLSNTSYYQPKISELSNYRLLSDNTLNYMLNEQAYITLYFNLLYKSEVVAGINEIEKKTGLRFGLRF